MADALKNIDIETPETINPFTLAPWEERVQTDMSTTPETHTEVGGSMQIALSSSARDEMVGFGGAIQGKPPRYKKLKLKTFSFTLGIGWSKTHTRGS